MAVYQRRTKWYFNKKVRHRSFGIGHWVLQKVKLATQNPDDGKLGLKWEDPIR
jgi:hypothetical protein